MSIKVTIAGEPGVFWAESHRENVRWKNEAYAAGANMSTRKTALRDLLRFCETTIRQIHRQLVKEQDDD